MNDLDQAIATVYEHNIRSKHTICDVCQSSENLAYDVVTHGKNSIAIKVWCSSCDIEISYDLEYKLNQSNPANILPKCMKLYPKFDLCLKCSSHKVVNMAKLDGRECLHCGFSSLIDPDDKRGVMNIGRYDPVKSSLCNQCNASYSLTKNVYESTRVKLKCNQCKFQFIYDLETLDQNL